MRLCDTTTCDDLLTSRYVERDREGGVMDMIVEKSGAGAGERNFIG